MADDLQRAGGRYGMAVSDTSPNFDPDAKVQVTMTLNRAQNEKLHAFMHSDMFDKAAAARDAKLEQCIESLVFLLNWVRSHRANSSRAIAAVLCSWYNGQRVKADLSDLWLIDPHLFEHVMNVCRLCYTLHREPHTFIKDGGPIFEELISSYRLEKRRRAA